MGRGALLLCAGNWPSDTIRASRRTAGEAGSRRTLAQARYGTTTVAHCGELEVLFGPGGSCAALRMLEARPDIGLMVQATRVAVLCPESQCAELGVG